MIHMTLELRPFLWVWVQKSSGLGQLDPKPYHEDAPQWSQPSLVFLDLDWLDLGDSLTLIGFWGH